MTLFGSEQFVLLFQQLVARSKEKTERLKSSSSISAEEHARVVQEMTEKHAAEVKKLQEAKNRALKEQRGMVLTTKLLLFV